MIKINAEQLTIGKGSDYPVVHLQHLMTTDPTDQSGIRPDDPVVRHATYTDWPRLDGRVGICVMALTGVTGLV